MFLGGQWKVNASEHSCIFLIKKNKKTSCNVNRVNISVYLTMEIYKSRISFQRKIHADNKYAAGTRTHFPGLCFSFSPIMDQSIFSPFLNLTVQNRKTGRLLWHASMLDIHNYEPATLLPYLQSVSDCFHLFIYLFLAPSTSYVIAESWGLLLFTPPAWLTEDWNTSAHTAEMLFMRQSEEEMLILPCYLLGIINQSQGRWRFEIFTRVCIQWGTYLRLLCPIFYQILRPFIKGSAKGESKSCFSEILILSLEKKGNSLSPFAAWRILNGCLY